MEFEYQNSLGEIKTFNLHQSWREEGKYVIGFDPSDERTKTFLKYRVKQYLNGSEKLLSDPFPPAPVKLHAVKKSRSNHESENEILFTGFPKEQRAILEAKAVENGMHVVKSVTENLLYLCGGPNAGPSKLAAARLKGCYILSPISLLHLFDTGELPAHDVFD